MVERIFFRIPSCEQIYASPHSVVRKIILRFNLCTTSFKYCSLGSQLQIFTCHSILFFKGTGRNPGSRMGIDPFYPAGDAVFQTFRGLYMYGLATLCMNRPRGTRWLYKTMSIFFGAIMLLMLFMGVWSVLLAIMDYNAFSVSNKNESFMNYLSKTPEFRDLIFALGSSYGLYLSSSLIHLDPTHIFTSMFQYLLLLPTYNNIFMIYSFCNLHYVSWVQKGLLLCKTLLLHPKQFSQMDR
jgi:chitin synthase